MKKMQYSTLTATGGLPLQNSCRLMVAGCQTKKNYTNLAPSRWRGVGVRPNSAMTKSPKKLLKSIHKYEKELENLKTLPYYRLFKQETEQQKDIAAVTEKLEKLRAKYSEASSSLQLSA